METADENIKTQIDNQTIMLFPSSAEVGVTNIATKKYLTGDNQFVYVTRMSQQTNTIPTLKVQLFTRVEGGVRETCYEMFGDNRFERVENNMIFGKDGQDATSPARKPVSQDDAKELLAVLQTLGPQNEHV